MLNNIDWQFLRRAIVIFVVLLLISVALVFAGIYYEDEQLKNYTAARSSLQSSHSRYDQLVKDLDLLEQYTETYNQYKDTGLLGGERRLSWIETLEQVNDELKLPTLRYSLLPQQGYSVPAFNPDRSVEINSTPMELNIALLHEGDLFSVFENINTKISNLFTIDSCKLKRSGRGDSALNTQRANLSSDCRLRWITVDVKQS